MGRPGAWRSSCLSAACAKQAADVAACLPRMVSGAGVGKPGGHLCRAPLTGLDIWHGAGHRHVEAGHKLLVGGGQLELQTSGKQGIKHWASGHAAGDRGGHGCGGRGQPTRVACTSVAVAHGCCS